MSYLLTNPLLDKLSPHSELRDLIRPINHQQVVGRFLNIDLTSHFEAIYDVTTLGGSKEVLGHEGLIRSFSELNQIGLTPYHLFALAARAHELVSLDRLCRTIHAINFFSQQQEGYLFLNVHERLLKNIKYDHGRTFVAILIGVGLNPSQVVIEIPEAAVSHKAFVEFILNNYRRNGFKVALNLPAVGVYHQFTDSLTPDFYKIDARVASCDGTIGRLVQYAEAENIPLIFKQIDHAERLSVLRQFGARYAQGKYFSEQAEITRTALPVYA